MDIMFEILYETLIGKKEKLEEFLEATKAQLP